MAFRDYRAPGVSVIVERQQGAEKVNLTQFYPVFVGTGMTSRQRVLSFLGVQADTSAFPNVTFKVDFSGLVNSQIYAESTFAVTQLTIDKQVGASTGPKTVLVKDTDYSEVSMITSVRDDGQASFTVKILEAGITATDLSYDFQITVTNAADSFDLRLVYLEDVYYASDIFGPVTLTENNATFNNDIAFAAEIAFRMNVPAFYYLEVPRDYGSVATKADIIAALEKIYYKKSAYRIVPLTTDTDVAAAVKSFVTSVSNPLDKRLTAGFVTYPVEGLTDINDIVELVSKVGNFSVTMDCPRMVNVFGVSTVDLDIGATTYTLPAYYLTVAVACLDSALGMADPLSTRTINIFRSVKAPRFRPGQWDKLAQSRVFILYQNEKSDPLTIRHQLTTSQSDAAEDQEWSLVKNVDAVSVLLSERLAPYSGKYNIVDGYIEKLDGALTSAMQEAIDRGLARKLTVKSPWAVRTLPTDSGSQVENRNLVSRLQMVPAYPANNLDVYLLI